MRKYICFIIVVMLILALDIFSITADEIISKMDFNKDIDNISYKGRMIIQIKNDVRVKNMSVKAIGTTKSIVEFTNPEDEGVKYLKLKKNLWIYFPDEQETVKISGHMLKEGMMGSDFSYEDALESDTLGKKYSITIEEKEEKFNKWDCFVLNLVAKVKKVSYYRRHIWVDKKSWLPVKEERFGKSGKLLKVMSVLNIQKLKQIYFPVKVKMTNMLRKNSTTIFIMKDVKINQPMKEKLFSLRYLQR